MSEFTGWLLDLYPHPGDGIVLWALPEDGGKRRRLHQTFPTAFYASGPSSRLRRLWRCLEKEFPDLDLARSEQRDLFEEEPLPVLEIKTPHPSRQAAAFARLKTRFPELTYYNADIPLDLRYAARTGAYPLARCRFRAGPEGQLQEIEALDTPWEIDRQPLPLRIMALAPSSNPFHREPSALKVRAGDNHYRFPFQSARSLLIKLRALLRRFDPDLLLTVWGDEWLFGRLDELIQAHGIQPPFNRDSRQEADRRPERYYHSYGGVIYRGPQVRLFGRLHISTENTVMYHDYGLEGVFEMARVTGLRVQTAARVSPGTGISSMQITTALRRKILVPWHKQQAERPKSAYGLLQADRGGLVFQPTIGLHPHVAEIDFVSMYPSIMEHFNVSPETVGNGRESGAFIPELGLTIDQENRGLVPDTLDPLLQKRIRLKEQLAGLDPRDVRCRPYRAWSSAHKWLLVTCFGYLGYKNARFGRIEAHEAVTAYGREALLRAKETAEELGFRVLHMYVDGLWVQKPGARQISDFQPLLEKILDRTGLPISLEGVYRWIAFLGSRQNPEVPVANRYFGVFQDGSLKLRGIEARRHDTPSWIEDIQREILELLAQVPEAADLTGQLPAVHQLLQERLSALRDRSVPLQDLLVSQKLSRPLGEYRVPSPAARAAAQLADIGKELTPGQYVRFLYTLGDPGVYAWDLPERPDPGRVDTGYYAELLLRAAHSVLEPLDVKEQTLRWWMFSNAGYSAPPGYLPENGRQTAPLLETTRGSSGHPRIAS